MGILIRLADGATLYMTPVIYCSSFNLNYVLFTGGSISNLYAFLAARHKMFPNYKEKGIATIQGQLVMFTSDQVSKLQRQTEINFMIFTSPNLKINAQNKYI